MSEIVDEANMDFSLAERAALTQREAHPDISQQRLEPDSNAISILECLG